MGARAHGSSARGSVRRRRYGGRVAASRPRKPESREGLECCTLCPSRLAYPVRCRRVGADKWDVDVRCPDCLQVVSSHGTTAELRRLDRALRAGRRVLQDHLREIERLEREAEIARFVEALAADAILPEDFRR